MMNDTRKGNKTPPPDEGQAILRADVHFKRHIRLRGISLSFIVFVVPSDSSVINSR